MSINLFGLLDEFLCYSLLNGVGFDLLSCFAVLIWLFFSTFFFWGTPLDIVDRVSLQSVAPEFLNHVNLVIDVPSLGIGQLPFLYCMCAIIHYLREKECR